MQSRCTLPLVVWLAACAAAQAQPLALTLKFERQLKSDEQPVYSVAWVDDATILAGRSGGKLQFWDWANADTLGPDLLEYTRHRSLVQRGSVALSLAVSKDRRWVAEGGLDGQVRVWRLTRELPVEFAARLLASDAAQQWIAASDGMTVRRFRTDNLKEFYEEEFSEDHDALAIAPDGRVFVGSEKVMLIKTRLAGQEQAIGLPYKLPEAPQNTPENEATPPPRLALAAAAAGAYQPASLMSFGSDGVLRTWRVAGQPLLASDALEPLAGNRVQVDAAGKFIAVARQDAFGVYRLSAHEPPKPLQFAGLKLAHPVRTLSWSPSGGKLAIVDKDSRLFILDALQSNEPALALGQIRESDAAAAPVVAIDLVALAAKGRRIAVANNGDPQIRVYDIAEAKLATSPRFHRYQRQAVTNLALIGSEGQWLVASVPARLRVWDMQVTQEDEQWLSGWRPASGRITALAWRQYSAGRGAAADSRIELAVGTSEGQILIDRDFDVADEAFQPQKPASQAAPLDSLDLVTINKETWLLSSAGGRLGYWHAGQDLDPREFCQLEKEKEPRAWFLDGGRVAVAISPSGPARMWMIAAGPVHRLLDGPARQSLAFSPRGDELLVVADRDIRRFERQGSGWQEQPRLTGSTQPISSVLPLTGRSKGGLRKLAVSASGDKTVRLWEASDDGEPASSVVATLAEPAVWLAAGQDEHIVLAGMASGQIEVVDLYRAEQEEAQNFVFALDQSAGQAVGSPLVAGDLLTTARAADATRLSFHTIGARHELIPPIMALPSGDGQTKDDPQKTPSGLAAQVYALEWYEAGAGGPLLMAAGGDGQLRLWPIGAARPFAASYPTSDAKPLYALAFDTHGQPAEHRVFVTGRDGKVAGWKIGDLLTSDPPQADEFAKLEPCYALAIRPDKRQLLLGCQSGNLYSFDLKTKKEDPPLRYLDKQAPKGTIFFLALHPKKSQLLATLDSLGYLRLWDLDASQEIDAVPPDSADAHYSGIAWSPDGQKLAAVKTNGEIAVFTVPVEP